MVVPWEGHPMEEMPKAVPPTDVPSGWFESHNASAMFAADPHQLLAPAPEKGDGVPVAARVCGRTKNAMAQIVQSGLFQFKTENDLVRTAIEMLLTRDLLPVLHGDSALAQSIRAQQRAMHQASLGNDVERLEKYVTDICRTTRKLLGLGLEERALEHLADIVRTHRQSNDRTWIDMAERALRRNAMIEKLWEEAELKAEFVKGHGPFVSTQEHEA